LFFAVFATSFYGEAFLLAFTIPNLFRRMLGEGTLSSAFIPVFSGLFSRGKEKLAWSLLNQTLSRLFLYLGAFSMVVCFLSWAIFNSDYLNQEKWQIASFLNVSTFSYALFICSASLLIAALNVKDRFLEGATSPIVLNSILIGILFFGIIFEIQDLFVFATLLGFGVLLSGIFQLLIPWVSLKIKSEWNWAFDYNKSESFMEVKALFWIGAFGAAVSQINILISRFLAYSLEDSGGVSLLYLASRLVELPLGIFAIALSTVLFPELARTAGLGNERGYQKAFFLGLRVIFALTIPAACALYMIPELIIGVLFEWNNFGSTEVLKASSVLKVAAWTIPAYASSTFFVKALHSQKRMDAPFHAAVVSLLVSLCFSLLLMSEFGVLGLAFANLIAAYSQCVFLAFKCEFLSIRAIFDSRKVDMLRILISVVFLALILGFGSSILESSKDKFFQCLQLTLLILIGISSYVAMLFILKFSWFQQKQMR
jgi:putative peptidoglycan lipid II flippase